MANDKLKRQLLGADYKKVIERQADRSGITKSRGSQIGNGPKRARHDYEAKVARNSHGSQSAVSRSAYDSDSDDGPGRSSIGKSRSMIEWFQVGVTGCWSVHRARPWVRDVVSVDTSRNGKISERIFWWKPAARYCNTYGEDYWSLAQALSYNLDYENNAWWVVVNLGSTPLFQILKDVDIGQVFLVLNLGHSVHKRSCFPIKLMY